MTKPIGRGKEHEHTKGVIPPRALEEIAHWRCIYCGMDMCDEKHDYIKRFDNQAGEE